MGGHRVLTLPVSVVVLGSRRSADAALLPSEPNLFGSTGAGNHHELFHAAATLASTESPGGSSR